MAHKVEGRLFFNYGKCYKVYGSGIKLKYFNFSILQFSIICVAPKHCLNKAISLYDLFQLNASK